MNKTEARYEQLLRIDPEVAWVGFEAWKFRLAASTFYSPDFLVVKTDRSLEAHEVKGFWRDDARVKIKVAASLYPFIRFIAVSWDRKQKAWAFEEIKT